jgi:hypothetical protein
MPISIRQSSVWRRLFQQPAQRRRAASILSRIEHLECRTVLSGMTVDIHETYRDFDFNVTGSAEGHTVIPDGYWNGSDFVDYHDNYDATLIPAFSSGSVSFTSATQGSGSAGTVVTGSGRDSFGPYDFTYPGTGIGTVNDGVLSGFFIFSPYPSDNFTKTGNFDPLSWAVNTQWNGAVFAADTGLGDGTTNGSFSGTLNQDDVALTDFSVAIVLDTAAAEAIHDDSHSPEEVAAAVKATITIEVDGRHMRAATMGSAATYAHIYLGAVDVLNEITDPVPIHWNAETVTIELTNFLDQFDIGDGKLYVVLDKEGKVEEADETNNQFELAIPYDLSVAGMGWGNDRSIFALFRVDAPGFSNGPLGGTFAEIFFADENGNLLDAQPGTIVIDPLASYSISSIGWPQTTNGNYLLGTFPLTWRPEGATQIAALIDIYNIPGNLEINNVNNYQFFPLTEITVTSPEWNADGSVDFQVSITQAPLNFDTNVTLFWGSGDLENPSLTKIIEVSLPKGPVGNVAFHIDGGTIGSPPAGTDALFIFPDAPGSGPQFGTILEPIENASALLPPNPLDLEFTGVENQLKTGTVKPGNVDAGTYHLEPGTDPQHGHVTVFSDGTFAYLPDFLFIGDDQFDYYIQGQDGRSLAATVTIHVIPFNGTPVPQDNDFLVQYNTPLHGKLTATDPEGDSLTFSLNRPPAHGIATVNQDGTFTYEPTPGYLGLDGFTFVATDGMTVSTPGNIGLSIETDNTAPLIGDQSFDVDEGAANGTVVGIVDATDDEGDGLTFGIVAGNDNGAFAIDPATGEITVNNSAALVFATHPTFSLTVGVQDDGSPNMSSSATITIQLHAEEVLSLSLNGGAVTYTKKQSPINVLPNVVVQVPGNDIGNGRLVISVDLVRKKSKVFDTIPGLQLASLLGTVTGPTLLSNGRTQLTIDLHSYIRGEDVQTFLRAFTFSTTGRGLKIAQRTVRVQLFDSEGGASNVLQQTINIRKK